MVTFIACFFVSGWVKDLWCGKCHMTIRKCYVFFLLVIGPCCVVTYIGIDIFTKADTQLTF